jgi:hypothetical protein
LIQDLLIQDRMLAKLNAAKAAAEDAAEALEQNDAAAVKLAEEYKVSPEQLRAIAGAAEVAIQRLQTDVHEPGAFMPRDPDSSKLQSALEAFYREQNCVATKAALGFDGGEADPLSDEMLSKDPLVHPPAKAELEAFGTHDPRWVFAFIAAESFAAAHGTCDFPRDRAPVEKLGAKARLVLVGDWASGIRRAVDVSDQMQQFALEGVAEGRDTHVISLGDVYYAGFDDEYKQRCLAFWPVVASDAGKIKSWALNGNHDMYAGGFGYFRTLLGDARFAAQNRSSYFLLQNKHWQIAGLDSAYDPPDFRGDRGNLYGGQAQWLLSQPRLDAATRTMLLSHHQLFSSFEDGSPEMEKALKPVFEQRNIDAWFWGHEHRCAVYRERDAKKPVKFASLIGHGGVPVKVGKVGDPAKAPLTYHYRDEHISGYQYLGFVVVDLDGAACTAIYYNERGIEHHREVI